MASIRKRPRADGSMSYAVLYRDGVRQRSVTFPTLREAKKFSLAVETYGDSPARHMMGLEEPGQGQEETPTVTAWVESYISNLTGVEQYTLDVYRRYLRNDIQPTFRELPLPELTEGHVADWIRKMESTPSEKTGRVVSPKTIRNKHAFLSAAISRAVGTHLPSNPAAGTRLPRKTGTKDDAVEDLTSLSRDEFDRLCDAVRPTRLRPLFTFLVASGCRWGEATALKPSDVDRDACTVRIRRAWKFSSAGYQLGAPKTARSRRVINLPRSVLDELDYSGVWLFEHDGNPIRYPWFKSSVWDPAVKSAGLYGVTPHALRHTCASWMLAAGVPLTTVSRHLGHQNISITADVYTDVDRTAHQAAGDAMGHILGP